MRNYLLRHRILSIITALILVIICYGAFLMAAGDRYTISLNYSFPDCEYEGTEVTFGQNGDMDESSILEVESVEIEDTCIFVTVKSIGRGSEGVDIVSSFKNDEGYSRVGRSEQITAGALGVIYNNQHRYVFGALAILSLILGMLFFMYFRYELKNNRYSYDVIFYLSAALFTFVLAAVWFAGTIFSLIRYQNITTDLMDTMNDNLIATVIFVTMPLMLVFAGAVSISNLQLMRKEGARPVNSLGILLSIVMILGFICVAVLTILNIQTDNLALEIVQPVVSSLYLIFEVVLFSTIFLGIYVAKHEPEHDRDFIVILGCKIRDDGTLYPLIKGRADRAVELYEAQLESTGKKAIFIPSGGQGSDEVISEGEAVANYLRSLGIPDEQIAAETESTTTRENMMFSKRIIDEINPDGKIAFSTTNYHVFRSGIIASEAGIEAEGVGVDTKWYFWPNAQLREVAGLFARKPGMQFVLLLLISVLAGFIGYLG